MGVSKRLIRVSYWSKGELWVLTRMQLRQTEAIWAEAEDKGTSPYACFSLLTELPFPLQEKKVRWSLQLWRAVTEIYIGSLNKKTDESVCHISVDCTLLTLQVLNTVIYYSLSRMLCTYADWYRMASCKVPCMCHIVCQQLYLYIL